MSVSVSVPDELYNKAITLPEAQHVSVDEVFASAFVRRTTGCLGAATATRRPWKPRAIPGRAGEGGRCRAGGIGSALRACGE